MPKERLDIIVQHRLGCSPSKAQGMIYTGHVLDKDGQVLKKPGLRLEYDTPLQVRDEARFVSRGGEKLEAAMTGFRVEVTGLTCIDVGASTGGFTDCLLQHGASRVFAVDVGYGQLAWRLRQDERVVVMERCNIRYVTPEQLDTAPTFFTADCSFISLKKVLPPVAQLLAPGARGIVLIKPQFEADRGQVGKGGVVRDESVREATIQKVCSCARELGFTEIDVIPSPLLGPAGNREFLAYLRGMAPGLSEPSASGNVA